MMYYEVEKYFEGKKDVSCPNTDLLIANGFQQDKNTGYMRMAKVLNIENPSQCWHLMNYCRQARERHLENKGYPYTPCGELVLWMAEASKAVDESRIEELVKRIISSGEINNRRKWNKEIKDICWNEVKKKVESK